MVRGMEVFKEYFSGFADHYVLIGGAACDVVFEGADMAFRATKDLDMVLIVEALTPEFGQRFWAFVREGGYENRVKSDGSPQFFRFDKPKKNAFPYMIELFARTESIIGEDARQNCIPLHMDDEISSLSAILLNADYYQMLLAGRTAVGGVTVLPHTYLIPFKAKAWLDLSARKADGQRVDDKDIRKHKNDVARLAALLTGHETLDMAQAVREDMARFIEAFERDPADTKALGLGALTADDVIDVLKRVYL